MSIKRNQFQNKLLLLFVLFSGIICWGTGCGNKGNETGMETYKQNMEQFFSNIAYLNDSINAIDPNSETAAEELLSFLDQAVVSFAQMAELPVPEVFTPITELADEADAYMTEAVNLYHQFYEADEPDENIFDAAQENNARANLRLHYIVAILRGENPAEDGAATEDGTAVKDGAATEGGPGTAAE